jgi:hypothetical protein
MKLTGVKQSNEMNRESEQLQIQDGANALMMMDRSTAPGPLSLSTGSPSAHNCYLIDSNLGGDSRSIPRIAHRSQSADA